ncbi:MAG TPA: ABC-F family ATPase [Gammaproteobacteria bacterium]|nr:ABC-F family ATPase [Gammaproteobacteria bacterium]
MLTTANITMQFGAKPLFENVSVKFGDGHRYGLIGANGCGKSTFMKILSQQLEPTSGNVSLDHGETFAVLKQDQFAYETERVIDVVIMGNAALWQVHHERERIYSLAEMSEEDGLKVAELEGLYAEMDGYTAESRAGELLLGVGIPTEQHYGPMSEIAPGWKLRILLAQVLFAEPDIMLLDEPTNHLDINTIRWLEDIINQRNGTMVIISHDRHFLNSVCTHIADLDYGELRIYPGNYDEYMLASTQVRARQLADNAKKKAQIAELQEFVRRFSANASKAKQATSRAKQIEKIQLDDIKPSSRVNPYIRFEQEKPLYRNAVEVENISQSYDNEQTIFEQFGFIAEVGERIGIIGANGIGKSTLVKTLANEMTSQTGQVKWSENANIGYYAQDHEHLFENDLNLYEWMQQWGGPEDDEQVIRGTLGRLLFSGNIIDKSVNVLSGGEKGRMMFGKLLLQKPNILIMDEPTNHMDMESIESLNMALERYEGTLIFVTHDREFISSLATRVFDMTGEGIVDFKGSYEEYLSSQGIQ